VSFLRPLEGLIGVLQRLSGMLVSAQVISLAVLHGGGAVRVRGKLVKLGSSLVRVAGHCVHRPRRTLIVMLAHFENCSIVNTEVPGGWAGRHYGKTRRFQTRRWTRGACDTAGAS
jgi:hypothetical protein